MVELARRQLASATSSGFSFVHIQGKDITETGQRIDNLLNGSELSLFILKVSALKVKNDDERRRAFTLALSLDEYDYIRLPYSEGRPYGYTLSMKWLKVLLKCFLDLQGNLIDFAEDGSRLLRNKLKFQNQAKKPQGILDIHRDLFKVLQETRINLSCITKIVGQNIQHSINSDEPKDVINAFRGVILVQSIMAQKPKKMGSTDQYSYTPAYNITGSNNPRPNDLVGLQGAKNDLLKLAMNAVQHNNYDIKSSNMNMLEKLTRDAGIENSWFVSYLQDPDKYRNELAKKVGVDVSVIKDALLALGNGAPFSPNKNGSVFKALVGDTDEETKKRCAVFLKEAKGIKTPMTALKKEIMDDKLWRYGKSHKNAIGQSYGFDKDRDESLKRRREKKLAAPNKPLPPIEGRFGQRLLFLVTGLEQKFITNLILALNASNTVYLLKHDGFICRSSVPNSLVDKIKLECDLPYLQFVKEPL